MTMLRRFNSTALEEMERMLSEFNPDDYARERQISRHCELKRSPAPKMCNYVK